MRYELGTIQVTAEVEDSGNEEIKSLHDVTTRYGFLRNRPKEHFYAVFLEPGNKVIGDKLIGLGDAGSTSVDTRDIARTAVLTNTSAVILVHNHPSSNTTATDTDRQTTRQVREALGFFDIEVLDHVIISQDGHYSMKQNNEL